MQRASEPTGTPSSPSSSLVRLRSSPHGMCRMSSAFLEGARRMMQKQHSVVGKVGGSYSRLAGTGGRGGKGC